MKKYITLYITLVAAFGFLSESISAQTFQLGTGKAPYVKDGIYNAVVYITNTASTDKVLSVKAILDGKLEDHVSYFCTGSNCYSPATTEVEYGMPAGITDSLISYLEPGEVNGTSIVKYEFADAQNPSDKIEYTFSFVVGPSSIHGELPLNLAVLSSPVPNPAVATALIGYSVPENSSAAIELYSSDSRLLKSFPVTGGNGSIAILTNEFPSGNYFYTLVLNGKKVSTNKLVITH